jgi:hypothetical protein
MPPKNPRVSLTKAQIQAGLGAELLALCQTVTADGKLTNLEIVELRAWLEANRTADLPAITFLVTTLERILADGVVTKEERKELHTAIEKVLPPEARRGAIVQRKAVEAEEKAEERREREAEKQREREEKQREREERERRRPVYSVNFMVAGVPYEGRDEIVRKYVAEGDTVYLIRDPENEYSRNAIEVRLANGMQIGFVPEDYAPEAAPFLNEGLPHTAHVTKIIGYRYNIPVVQAYIYRQDSDEPDLVFPTDVPAKPHAPARQPAANEQAPRKRQGNRRRGEEANDWSNLGDGPRSRKASGTGCVLLLMALGTPTAVLTARAMGLLG